MKPLNSLLKSVALALAAASLSSPALAELTNPAVLDGLGPLEQAAARANQAVYDRLTGGSEPLCFDQQRAPSGACTGPVFDIFRNVRELVHTSNQLAGSGPTEFSLGLDLEGLGFALRWTAAEELSAQGASATRFANDQLGSLASRLSALRFGVRGSRLADVWREPDGRVAFRTDVPLGGGASADEPSIARRWGVFLDGSFGYGRKADTTFAGGFENAFDFEGTEATLGVDFRVSPRLVVGGLFGYTDRAVDFDSRFSVVDGRIDSDGESLMLYGLWEAGGVYLSGSVGGQRLSHELERRITYPSLNPLVSSTDVTARGDTRSSALIASFGAGYGWSRRAFTLEPFLKGEYQDIRIRGFTERDADGFEFAYGRQDVQSFDLSGGLKLQYVLTPRFGVVIPYLRAEYHRELENGPRRISAVYAGLAALEQLTGADFALPTDAPDEEFYVAAAGFSVVLRRGLQGFLQFQRVFDLDTVTDRAITGGVRLEL